MGKGGSNAGYQQSLFFSSKVFEACEIMELFGHYFTL